MRSKEAFIDANLLVLLVVGQVDRTLIERHRRTRRFTPEDYDRLLGIIQTLNRVFVTPNTLTEASNLLKYDRMNLTRLLEKLRSIIEDSEEIIVDSTTAAHNSAFTRLGLTDAALLEVISAERPLITADLDLYSATKSRQKRPLSNAEGLSTAQTVFRIIGHAVACTVGMA